MSRATVYIHGGNGSPQRTGVQRAQRGRRACEREAPLSGVVRPTVDTPHPWSSCCRNTALDLIDFYTVWGFGQVIRLRDWAERSYGEYGENVVTAGRQWCRLKRRLRDHGVQIRVPMLTDSEGATQEMEPGGGTWMMVEPTEKNRSVFERLSKRLDERLLSEPEHVWRTRDKRHRETLKEGR